MTLDLNLLKQIPLRVRVTTDPYAFGDAPINSFHTFEVLLLEALPQLSWQERATQRGNLLELHTDEDSSRQRLAETVLHIQMRCIGVEPIFKMNSTAEERVDACRSMLKQHFGVD